MAPHDVVGVLGPFVPREFEDGVQPGADPGALGALVAGPLQLVDLLEGGLADVLGQVGGLDPGAVVVALVLRIAVEPGEFLADRLQLPPQQELPLLLVDAFLDVLGDGLGDVLLGEVLTQRLGGVLQPCDRVDGLQQPDLLFGGQERRIAGVVGERRHILDLLDAVDDLPGAALAQPAGGQRLVFRDEFGHRAGQGIGDRLLDGGALHPERGPGPGSAGTDPHPAQAPDQRAGIAVGQPPDLLDPPERADRGVLPVDAGHKQHPRFVTRGGGGLCGLHRCPYVRVGQVQRHHHAGEHDLVIEGQHGQSERCGRRSHDLPFGKQVELYSLNAEGHGDVPPGAFAVSDQGSCRFGGPGRTGPGPRRAGRAGLLLINGGSGWARPAGPRGRATSGRGGSGSAAARSRHRPWPR